MHSAIYEGRVRHRRFTPVKHEFQYRLFMMYLDLDELPRVFRGHPLWSNEGWSLARFRRRDHLKCHAPADRPLAEAVRDLVEARTGVRPAGPIRLLTHCEYFRHRFNPVSFYFCFDAAGAQVETIIAEINNTPWREQHCYVLSAKGSAGSPTRPRFEFDKDFHISPFMDMKHDYVWRFTPPDEQLAIHMENFKSGERYFDATLSLRRRDITRWSLTRVLMRFPLMTAHVLAAIYWQAFRLWLKRCPSFPHPRSPAERPPTEPRHVD